MALLSCPECEKLITTRFKACPHCGIQLNISERKPSYNKFALIAAALILAVVTSITTPYIIDHIERNETVKIAESEVDKHLSFRNVSIFVDKKAYKYSHEDYQVLLIVETPSEDGKTIRQGFVVEIINNDPQVIRQGTATEMERLWSPEVSRIGAD